MPGISCRKPDATFVLFADISGLPVVPGGETFFGPGSEGYIRICLATSREVLEEGLNRLEEALKAMEKDR